MFPKALKVSYSALLSMDLSRFLMKMFPTPERRREGSRCDHIIRIGRPLMGSKFMVSRALSAGVWEWGGGRRKRGRSEHRRGRSGKKGGGGKFPVKIHLTLVSLTVCWLLEVDIGVAKTPPGHDVSAHSDGENRSRRAEPLEQHGLANLGVEVSHVQRGDRIAGRVCHRHSQVFGSEFESPREIKHS